MSTKDIVVFIVRRDTQCSVCKKELFRSSFIYLKDGEPLCLSCAGLGHLVYLPSGDAALTRRTIKHSKLYAVVVQWSYTRKRYERQGILAEPSAIELAKEECLRDAELRKAKQQKEQLKRSELDKEYINKFANEIRKHFPNCPPGEEFKIAEYACEKYSGRIGRTSLAKSFHPRAIYLAVEAHIRHNYTKYDEILIKTGNKGLAIAEVKDKVWRILNKWQGIKVE